MHEANVFDETNHTEFSHNAMNDYSERTQSDDSMMIRLKNELRLEECV